MNRAPQAHPSLATVFALVSNSSNPWLTSPSYWDASYLAPISPICTGTTCQTGRSPPVRLVLQLPRRWECKSSPGGYTRPLARLHHSNLVHQAGTLPVVCVSCLRSRAEGREALTVPGPPASVPTASAEDGSTYKDPSTSTPFPTSITSPSGSEELLVGTGLKCVSFLNIRVYAAGIYVQTTALERIRLGKLAGWEVRLRRLSNKNVESSSFFTERERPACCRRRSCWPAI